VVSPNLAIDRIIELDSLLPRQVQRSQSVLTQPGGKGSNVARVFRQLGGEVALLGFAGRLDADCIREPLETAGVQVNLVEGYDGGSRVCTIILEREPGNHPTVINEESGGVAPEAVADFHSRLHRLLERAKIVLVTGSLSRGLPENFYATVIRQAVHRGIRCVFDATGSTLKHGIAARPDIIKTNLQEITTVTGPLGCEVREIADSLRRHQNRLAPQIIATLGRDGAILIFGDQAWHAEPPRISYTNPIGAGDAFAAGYLKALLDNTSPVEALRIATAAAASDAATREAGIIIPTEIESLVERIMPARL